MKIQMPQLDKRFFYGSIVSFKFIENAARDHNIYRVKYKLTHQSGDEFIGKKSGFQTRKEALNYRDYLLVQLYNGNFFPYQFTIEQVFDFWLYHQKLQVEKIKYHTFISYRNLLYNHILSRLNRNCLIANVTSEELVAAIEPIENANQYRTAISLMKRIFTFAYDKKYIPSNPAIVAGELLRQNRRSINQNKKRNIYWTAEMVGKALCTCRDHFPELYIPLLLSVCTGCRISELIALKYKHLNLSARSILIQGQMGKEIAPETLEITKVDYAATKSEAGVRNVPLAEWVIDELIVHRRWYETMKQTLGESFHDLDYICCRANGRPYHRASFSSDFKDLLAMCGFKEIHWHDLRHVYASVLKNNNVSLKQISVFLGHTSEKISNLYIDEPEYPISDCTAIEQVWDELFTKKNQEETTILSIPISDAFLYKEIL